MMAPQLVCRKAVVDLESGLVFVSGQVDWDVQHRVSSDSVSGRLASALEKLKIAPHASESRRNLTRSIRGRAAQFFP
jgi:2-iminobutanoate/2-iminopropanoate deaminase